LNTGGRFSKKASRASIRSDVRQPLQGADIGDDPDFSLSDAEDGVPGRDSDIAGRQQVAPPPTQWLCTAAMTGLVQRSIAFMLSWPCRMILRRFSRVSALPSLHRPNNRKQASGREEGVLRSLSKEVDQWLSFALNQKGK
jgi:hypothetical protein